MTDEEIANMRRAAEQLRSAASASLAASANALKQAQVIDEAISRAIAIRQAGNVLPFRGGANA